MGSVVMLGAYFEIISNMISPKILTIKIMEVTIVLIKELSFRSVQNGSKLQEVMETFNR